MKTLFSLALLALVAACGAPERIDGASVEIVDAWAAPSPGGVDVAAGYLTIVNASPRDDALVAASSPAAGRVELHEMSMDGDVMRMRQVDRFEIAAGAQAELAPGGAHLMFMQLPAPLNEGSEVALQLTFEQAGPIDVVLPVRRPGGGDAH